MTMTRTGGATALALVLMLGAAAPAAAQSATEDPHHPSTGPQAGSEPTRPGTPEPEAGQPMMMNPHMMHEMMRQMMAQGGMGQGMMQPTPGMMGQAPQAPMGPGMMGPGMGQGMMQPTPGMMGQAPQGPMGPGMMGSGMGQGMMQPMPGLMGQGMTEHEAGAMAGWRITPVVHLGVEDVQHYLEHFIESHELQHLKVGEVRPTDDDTITADLVTQEGSLALQLEVDRHTGLVRKIS